MQKRYIIPNLVKVFRTPPKPMSCVRQCSAATIPLQPRFVPLCGLRYINASGIAAPNPADLIGVLHIVFIPCQRTSLSCCHSPLWSLHSRFPTAHELPWFLVGHPRPSRPDNSIPLRRADVASIPPASSARSAFSPLSGRWLYHRLKAL